MFKGYREVINHIRRYDGELRWSQSKHKREACSKPDGDAMPGCVGRGKRGVGISRAIPTTRLARLVHRPSIGRPRFSPCTQPNFRKSTFSFTMNAHMSRVSV